LREQIRALVEESIELKRSLIAGSLDSIVNAVEAIKATFGNGGKLLLFGNGGSAADAQHIAAEFVNKFQKPRPPLPALALTTDTSVITSVGNDEAFQEIFAKQIRALGSRGDVAWGITTSGLSTNVVLGLEAARDLNLITIGMTGGSGGDVAKIADHWINVNSDRVPRIQEVHITIGHIICELVEEGLY
jgi:D-sedoheptulose 7-phosphate isomerase